jgi:N-dimethylarginine dimethylaminohydrolase
MKLNSHNEWDPLKAVVVGTVDGLSPGLEAPLCSDGVLSKAAETAKKAFPGWYLDEVAEDLELLCGLFTRAGVTVLRPSWTEGSSGSVTPNWAASGFDIYNVRDLHVVVGSSLIACAPSSRFRLFERYAFRDLFYQHFFEQGFKWIEAPLPRLRGTYRHEIERQPNAIEAKEEELHKSLSRGLTEVFHRLDEEEIIFDAANVIRVGRDVLFLVSSTGNRKAATWLASILGPEYRVHVTHTYRSSHLDSTILPLRLGTVILNGARVTEQTCPGIFDGWEKLYLTDVAPVPEEEVDFHNSVRLPVSRELRALGIESNLHHISSPWAGLNVMSIDPNTVLVHDRQINIIKTLEARRFTVIPVQMRHCYTMLGGLHCTTLDVVRDSTL